MITMRWTEAVTINRNSRDRLRPFYPAQTLVSRTSARSTSDVIRLQAMESKRELLNVLQHIVENPTIERPLRDWVEENLASLESLFDRRDYLKLKRRGLIGALSVLERHGRIEPTELESTPIDYSEKHCRYCGNDLFWALPGKTSRDDIVQYARKIGDEQIAADAWIHPGVYCPNGCTCILFNIAQTPIPEPTSENDG